MNSSEGQEALESMVGQMLVAKLKKLGAQEHKVDQIVASLSPLTTKAASATSPANTSFINGFGTR